LRLTFHNYFTLENYPSHTSVHDDSQQTKNRHGGEQLDHREARC
jgi:hypothetical protein